MQLTERSKVLVLMFLHLIWGSVLWFSISKYGLGVSTDAVSLLFGGQNLASGNGLRGYDGSLLILWPPLYPVLLAMAHWSTGLDMLASAALVQVLAFAVYSASLTVLFVRIFRQDFGLAILASVLAQVGSIVVIGFGTVGSDYIHLGLAMLMMALAGSYLESGSKRAFTALAAAAILTTMQRYLGAAALAASVAAILLLSRERIGRRVRNALVLSSTLLPTAIWMAITSRMYALRAPITFEENFAWFSRSILEWFVEPGLSKKVLQAYVPTLWVIVLMLVLVVLASFFGRRPSGSNDEEEIRDGESGALLYLLPFLLYGVSYTLALFGSASVAYFNKLGGRFLLPLYAPLIALPVAAAAGIIRAARSTRYRSIRRIAASACYLALVLLAAAVLRNTYPIIMESHANGTVGGENAYNDRTWRENPAIQYWHDHEPTADFLLFTNEPDGVSFHTQHPALAAPRKTSGPYDTAEIPLSDYRAELFGAGTDVYLIWIEPSPYEHYYVPDDLGAIAILEPLLTTEQGSVFRLLERGSG